MKVRYKSPLLDAIANRLSPESRPHSIKFLLYITDGLQTHTDFSFEVSMPVSIQIVVSWVITPYTIADKSRVWTLRYTLDGRGDGI
jgi:hypothetical protein